MRSALLLAFAAATLGSCNPVPCAVRLGSLGTHPEQDARLHILFGDRRLRSVYGYAETAPGVDYAAAQRHRYRAIEGTSDMVLGEACERWNNEAYAYAERYNVEVMKHDTR